MFAISLDNPDKFDEFDSRKKLEKYKVEDVINGHKSIYWKPAHIDKHIIVQHSYFIVGGHIYNFDVCFIPEDKKEHILGILHRFYDIKRTTLFPGEGDFTEGSLKSSQYTEVYLEYLDAGLKFLRRGEYKQAIERYTKIIDNKKYKKDYKMQAYNNRGLSQLSWGDMYRETGQYDKAEEKYKNAIEDLKNADQNVVETYNSLGIVRYSLGQNRFAQGLIEEEIKEYMEALQYFKRALKINDESPKIYNNMGLVRKSLADICLRLNNKIKSRELLNEANQDFNKGIELDLNYADIYNNRAEVWFKLGNLQKALNDVNNTIRLNYRHYKAYTNRAIIQTGIIRGRDRLNEYKGLGSKLKEDYRKAILDCDKSIEINAVYWQSYSTRGAIKLLLGEYQSAHKDLDKALSINSDPSAICDTCINLLSNSASQKIERGDDQGALDAYQCALKYLEIIYEYNINNKKSVPFLIEKRKEIEQKIQALKHKLKTKLYENK